MRSRDEHAHRLAAKLAPAGWLPWVLLFIIPVELNALSRGAFAIIDEKGNQVAHYADSHALVVGVSDYKYWPQLRGVRDDLMAVERALSRHGFEVKLVMDPSQDELERTYEEFILKRGVGDANEQNRLLFYFAGHGHTEKPSWATDDPEEWMGYIVSRDAPLPSLDKSGFMRHAMSMQRFGELAQKIEAKHALFVFDSCFSGSLFSLTRDPPPVISRKTSRPVRQFITSGSADQLVPDVSVFRRQFIAALEGEADLIADGYVTASELGNYLESTVANYTKNAQTPQYGKLRHPRLDKGDFVFEIPPADPPASLQSRPSVPPPPPPIAFTGNVQVNVNVPATVYIDERAVGEAAPGKPINHTGVPTGNVEVRVEARGHPAATKTATVRRGQWVQLVFELPHPKPAPALTKTAGVEPPPDAPTEKKTTVASAARREAVTQKTDTKRRLAVLRMDTAVSCNLPRTRELLDIIEKLIAEERDLELVYSYYEDDGRRLGDRRRRNLWSAKGPNSRIVDTVANDLRADAVFMAWLDCTNSPNIDDDQNAFEAYLFDARTGVLAKETGVLREMNRVTRDLIVPAN